MSHLGPLVGATGAAAVRNLVICMIDASIVANRSVALYMDVATTGKTKLEELPRSIELGIVREDEVGMAIDTIEASYDRPQVSL